MINIVNYIRGESTKNALEVLYYTARFIKQAKRLDEDDKDIFDDDVESAPSEEARASARGLIAAIEADAGKPSAEFDDFLVIKILNELTSAEEALDIEFTPAEKEGAEKAIESMIEPTVRTKDPNQPISRKFR